MCRYCDGRIHTFVCFMSRFATDFNRNAGQTGNKLNAR